MLGRPGRLRMCTGPAMRAPINFAHSESWQVVLYITAITQH